MRIDTLGTTGVDSTTLDSTTLNSTTAGVADAEAPAGSDAPAGAAPTTDTGHAGSVEAPDATDRTDTRVPRVRVRDLHVGFDLPGGYREIVRGLSFDLHAGRCVAIVGESGSGKSVTARTLVGLPGHGARIRAEQLELGDLDIRSLSAARWKKVRGEQVGFVLQDALVSLDPLRPVGREIGEALRLHGWGDRRSRAARVLELLAAAGVPNPEVRAGQRPDQLSGGLRQRALIASAIALEPDVLIADEPTTALDVTVQAQVLDVFEQMKAAGRSIVLISHDLSVVAHLADEVLVMRGGEVVEQGPPARILGEPAHPYTQALIRAVPSARTRGTRLSPTPARAGAAAAVASAVESVGDSAADAPVLEARDLVKTFRTPGGGTQRAVDGVSFSLRRGETLGIVGESGSGKSTTARIALGLETADSGEVTLLGRPWSALPEARRRAHRSRISVVYQDPLSSFDPRWTVERILADALPAGGDGRASGGGGRTAGSGGRRTAAETKARIAELLDDVGLSPDVAGRNPATMSGGQRQRVAIARALAPEPDVIVLDEAVSALDVSVQAQILDLLADLQAEHGTSYLFISHDLGVISHQSDRVLVMQSGRVVEEGRPEALFTRPRRPYTATLVASLHTLDGAQAGAADAPGDRLGAATAAPGDRLGATETGPSHSTPTDDDQETP